MLFTRADCPSLGPKLHFLRQQATIFHSFINAGAVNPSFPRFRADKDSLIHGSGGHIRLVFLIKLTKLNGGMVSGIFEVWAGDAGANDCLIQTEVIVNISRSYLRIRQLTVIDNLSLTRSDCCYPGNSRHPILTMWVLDTSKTNPRWCERSRIAILDGLAACSLDHKLVCRSWILTTFHTPDHSSGSLIICSLETNECIVKLHALPRIKPFPTRIKKAGLFLPSVNFSSFHSQLWILFRSINMTLCCVRSKPKKKNPGLEMCVPFLENLSILLLLLGLPSPSPLRKSAFMNLTTQDTIANTHPNNFVHTKKKSEFNNTRHGRKYPPK